MIKLIEKEVCYCQHDEITVCNSQKLGNAHALMIKDDKAVAYCGNVCVQEIVSLKMADQPLTSLLGGAPKRISVQLMRFTSRTLSVLDSRDLDRNRGVRI